MPKTARAAWLMATLCLGLGWGPAAWGQASAPAGAATTQTALPSPLRRVGIENLFQVSPRIYSGASPEGEAGFAELRKLGITTLISVDGSKPDAELARRHGMRYIHLPHGYDGIPPERQAELIQAATGAPGPIFIHCHHGKHRGPAAVAVVCMGTEGWSKETALSWMRTAGTDTNYTGLFGAVAGFRAPTKAKLAEISKDFPEAASLGGLAEAMVAVDGRWDNLKAARKNGYQTPKEHPDLKPEHEALMLAEHFREAQRLPAAAERGEDFAKRLKAAEAASALCAELLRKTGARPKAELDRSFDAVGQSCAACHKAYRDHGPSPAR